MSNWILDGVSRDRAARDREQANDAQLLHHADVIKAKARALLDELVAVMGKDVQFHAEQVDPEQRFSFDHRPSGGCSVSRSRYPASEMVCVLDLPAQAIILKGYVTVAKGALTRTYERRLSIRVDQNDDLYLAPPSGGMYKSLADASRDLLEPGLFLA